MRARTAGILAAALTLPLLLLVLGGSPGDNTSCAGVPSSAADQGAGPELDAEQLHVAEQVVLAVRAFAPTSDLPHAAVIALATARQESGLRNLPYGDRDSLGVFQQRPFQGWGTPEQILDVPHATTTFLEHLIRVPDWQTVPVTEAAAAVQRPAAENAGLYQQWVPLATELATTLWPATVAVSRGICLAAQPFNAGVVTYPVPVDLASADLHNWGGHGDHWASWHTGTDFSVPCGTAVLAAISGTIEIQPGPDWYGQWLVKIVTGTDAVATWYAHMQRVTVADGEPVTAGQQIGEVGDLGNTTGCHLHFELHLHDGPIYGADNTDPSTWLAQHVGHPLVLDGSGDDHAVSSVARVATFNVLGASHTAPGGNSDNHIDGSTRMRWTVLVLADLQIDIVGMQEFEPSQESTFTDLTTGSWDHFPQSDGEHGAANVVAWRTDRWSQIAADRIPIPYFHGNPVRMPYVLLQDPDGHRVWVISVHNPADTRGPAQQWRDQAVRAEAALIARLSADGTPVILTGDMNDRARFFCAITADATLHAASSSETGPPCRPPASTGIDWIVGTTEVTFSDYASTRRSPIDRASDHPLNYADVSLE